MLALLLLTESRRASRLRPDGALVLLADQDLFFFSSRRRHTRFSHDWSSDVCSSDLIYIFQVFQPSQNRSRSESLSAFQRVWRFDSIHIKMALLIDMTTKSVLNSEMVKLQLKAREPQEHP